MTLKIETAVSGEGVVVKLSGRMRSEHLVELASLIENSGRVVALDLDQITQVDVDTINFLRECLAGGIELRHCSPYICEWIAREQDR